MFGKIRLNLSRGVKYPIGSVKDLHSESFN